MVLEGVHISEADLKKWNHFTIILTDVSCEPLHVAQCAAQHKLYTGKKGQGRSVRELISIQYPSGRGVTLAPTNGTINQGNCIVQSLCFRYVWHTEISGAEGIFILRQRQVFVKKNHFPYIKRAEISLFLTYIVFKWQIVAEYYQFSDYWLNGNFCRKNKSCKVESLTRGKCRMHKVSLGDITSSRRKLIPEIQREFSYTWVRHLKSLNVLYLELMRHKN